MITRSDLDNIWSLWQTYSDLNELILDGSIALTCEQATELAYYQIVIQSENVDVSTMPDDLSPFLPKGMKPTKNMKKDLKQMFTSKPLKDTNEARRKYITLIKSIDTFGSEVFKCQYSDLVKGQQIYKECLLYVTPYKIYAIDSQSKKRFLFLQYSYKIRFHLCANSFLTVF